MPVLSLNPLKAWFLFINNIVNMFSYFYVVCSYSKVFIIGFVKCVLKSLVYNMQECQDHIK